MTLEYEECLKAHGITNSEGSSDSDMSMKDKFDETYYRNKPPLEDIKLLNIVHIPAQEKDQSDMSLENKTSKLSNEISRDIDEMDVPHLVTSQIDYAQKHIQRRNVNQQNNYEGEESRCWDFFCALFCCTS